MLFLHWKLSDLLNNRRKNYKRLEGKEKVDLPTSNFYRKHGSSRGKLCNSKEWILTACFDLTDRDQVQNEMTGRLRKSKLIQ